MSLFILKLEQLSRSSCPYCLYDSSQGELKCFCFVTLSNTLSPGFVLFLFTQFPSVLFALALFPVQLNHSPLSKLFVFFCSNPAFCSRLHSPSCTLTFLPFTFLYTAAFSLWRSLCTRAGTEKKFELTPVAAISVHLLASDGAELQVNGPIRFSVPLPTDSNFRENDQIPAWRFDPRLGKS